MAPNQGPQDLRGFTKKQQHALQVAHRSSPASARKLRASFTAQRSGTNGGGASRRANPRPQRQRARNQASVPAHAVHSQASRAMRQAWRVNPATSNMLAPQGQGYYDAFNTFAGTAMTHLSIGPATPIVAKTTCLFPTGATIRTDWTHDAQMLIIGPCSSNVQGKLFRCSSSVSDMKCASFSFASSQLSGDDGLTETIPTRCSVRIRNFTNALNLGGTVRILRATTGMHLDPDYTSNAELKDLMQGIRDHRRTCTYTGKEFISAQQKNCIVADQSRSLLFTDNSVSSIAGQMPWFTSYYLNKALPQDFDGNAQTFDYEKLVDAFTVYLANPTFSPIVMLFEPFGADATQANTYEVIVQSQFLAHYRQGTMLANLAIQPSSNHSALERHRNAEEKKGSMLSAVGQYLYDHRTEIASGLSTLGRSYAAGFMI